MIIQLIHRILSHRKRKRLVADIAYSKAMFPNSGILDRVRYHSELRRLNSTHR